MRGMTNGLSRGFALVFIISVALLLQGCYTVKCEECDKCDPTIEGSGNCIKHRPDPLKQAEVTMCPGGGLICNTPNGPCHTAAVPNGHCVQVGQGGTCACNCMP